MNNLSMTHFIAHLALTIHISLDLIITLTDGIFDLGHLVLALLREVVAFFFRTAHVTLERGEVDSGI